MLFTYSAVMDEYRELYGDSIAYIDYPSPEKCQSHVIEMFETDAPDNLRQTRAMNF